MYTKQAATDLTTRHFQGPFWRLAALLCQHSLQGCEGAYWGITGAALGPDPHSCLRVTEGKAHKSYKDTAEQQEEHKFFCCCLFL